MPMDPMKEAQNSFSSKESSAQVFFLFVLRPIIRLFAIYLRSDMYSSTSITEHFDNRTFCSLIEVY